MCCVFIYNLYDSQKKQAVARENKAIIFITAIFTFFLLTIHNDTNNQSTTANVSLDDAENRVINLSKPKLETVSVRSRNGMTTNLYVSAMIAVSRVFCYFSIDDEAVFQELCRRPIGTAWRWIKWDVLEPSDWWPM